MAAVRVLIVDDSEPFRTRIQALLEGTAGIDVVGVAATVDEGLGLLDRVRPDVVVLDLVLPDRTGVDFLEALQSDPSAPDVVVLTEHDLPRLRERCLELGARAFMAKDRDIQRLRAFLEGYRAHGPLSDAGAAE